MSELHDLSATELIKLYRTKQVSPVEMMKHTLDLAWALNPTLNALYYIDSEGALKAAQASEQRWLKGAPKGRLDGIPTTVKDGLAARGMPTFRGTAASDDTPAKDQEDCPAIARMREEGAIVFGKATMCDFGILPAGYSSRFGPTCNPINPAYNTGGSSSGTAACVAAGLGPIAVGTDIVGSIRLPASFCGIYGLKPSQGRVPYHYPNSPYLVAGPMTRTVTDAALLLDVITRPDERDFTRLPWPNMFYEMELNYQQANPRIGYISHLDLGLEPNAEVQHSLMATISELKGLGLTVSEIATPFTETDADIAESFFKARCLTELEKLPDHQQQKAELIYKWTRPAQGLSARDLYEAYLHLQTIAERAIALFKDFDFILLPTVPAPPYKAQQPAAEETDLFAPWAHTFPFNLSGQPAASINCGYTKQGLPIGLQIVGQPLDDIGVLRFSKLLEENRGAAITKPSIAPLSKQADTIKPARREYVRSS